MKKICENCTEYMKGVKCECEKDCVLMKLVRENEVLKQENTELKIKISYMNDPCVIGERNDMGW